MRQTSAIKALVAFVIFLWLVGPSVSYPASKLQDPQVETLKGLKGVRVFVGVSSGAKKAGVNENQIKTDVELRLRKAGIKVFSTIDESRETPGAPFFYVNIDIIKLSPDLYSFNIDLSLLQLAILHRDGILPIKDWDSTERVITWTGGYGIGAVRSIKEIRESIADAVDKFSNDFLSVNSK
jgi:hypothetical protein